MNWLFLVCVLIGGCTGVALQRRLAIESAEDRFCALRAEEKRIQDGYSLGEAGSK